jgi:hypothetical protein
MAITSAALQAALGGHNEPEVLMMFGGEGAAKQQWLIAGGVTYPGRVKMIATTAADNAATQASAIRTALLAGPA